MSFFDFDKNYNLM